MNYFKNNWSELLLIINFAAAMLVQESTELILFIADCGYKPRTLFDWQPLKKIPAAERLNRENACARVKDIEEV
jgi:lipopolysaccharide biosynthesis protein